MFSSVENEIKMVNEQTTKHIKAKLAIQELNEFYKKQITVIKEEGELRMQVPYKNTKFKMKSYHKRMSNPK